MSEVVVTKWSDLRVRTLSAAALIPLVLLDIWFGGVVFTCFIVALGLLMAREWVRINFGANQTQLLLHFLAATTPIMGPISFSLFLLLILSLLSIWFHRKNGFSFWNCVGIGYVGLPILALSLLRNDVQFGLLAVIWCLLIVWAADIMAYFFGRIIGGPKLAPRISPKKTWAGLLGAIFGAVAASCAVSYFASLNIWPLAGLAAIFAILEQGGDIFESAFKRHYGVKDSGNLIPGHGGVLDRIDGLIAVVVAAVLVGFLHNPASPAAGLMQW